MAEHELIRSGQQRLALYRRTIAFLTAQLGQEGSFAPAEIARQLDDTRREIWLIKRELRAHGAAVDDQHGDGVERLDVPGVESPADAGHALLPRYRRMLAEQLRTLSLVGISDWNDARLPLADIYIERMLAQTSRSGDVLASSDLEPAASTLTSLMHAPRSRVLLESDRGGGKSICMRRVALACVASVEDGPVLAAEPATTWAGPAPLPILLYAHMLEAALDLVQEQPLASAPRVWLAIEDWLLERDLGPLAPIMLQALERGDCLIVVDGLDDQLEGAAAQGLIVALDAFIACYPGNRFVVAFHRLDSTAAPPLPGFARYTLVPLDRARIDMMIERWYRALAGAGAPGVPADVSELVVRLQGLLHGNELLDELAESPLLLALWILTHARGQSLPAALGVIRARQCDLLLNGWGHGGPPGLRQALGFDLDASTAQRLALLEPLALALQSRYDRGADQPAISASEAAQLLQRPLIALGVEPGRALERVIPRLLAWCCRAGLLAEAGPAAYALPRRSLREYLAARALTSLPDFSARARAGRHDPRWREALALVVYELAHGPAARLVDDLIGLLMRPSEPSTGFDRYDLLLAAECLAVVGELPATDRRPREAARRRLVELLAPGRASLEERIQAGTLLGRLGDPRFGAPLPALAAIAAGTFIFGSSAGYDDEGPAQRVDVPAFVIGIYPITNQDYAAFLNDSAHPPPRYWHDSRFNKPAYPAVGVTWHDAMAYCAWLQGRLAAAGLLAPGTVVRLPLEVEWEKAASWDPLRQAKRLYAWGDDWSDARANTAAARGPWLTTPVGCYPEGVSAYGLHDCIGNVWEWTASEYRSYPGAPAPFYEPGSYTLRGSSCVSLPNQARCTYRSRLPANYWRYHLGFRIVIARPLGASALL